jgi:hypothetical protein
VIKRPRKHDEKHLAFIRELPCVCCGDDVTVEAAHLRAGNLDYGKPHTGMAEKPGDLWALPLCGRHHRDQHKTNEIEFWMNQGINPWVLALSLYASSGDSEMASTILERQRENKRT